MPTQVFERSQENNRNRSGQASSDEFRLKGEVIAETAHFIFYADQGYFPVDVEEFKEQAEVVFDYVSTRLKTAPERKVALSFRPPSTNPCPARGLAMPGERPPRIFIMADEQTSQAQILGVLAHEVGHILHAASDLPVSNRALNEGLATWAAGEYWNTWQNTPSLDARVSTYLENSTYLPLYENYEMLSARRELSSSNSECLAQRDILYTEWAAFIAYLVDQHGWEKLQALFESPTYDDEGREVIVRPPDFPGVYGSSLNQLEAAWLEQLLAGE